MRYQDPYDASPPRRAHQATSAQRPPWDGEATAGFQSGGYGNDAFDDGAYGGGGYGNPGYRDSGPQRRADDFDAFGGAGSRRASTGGFASAGTGGIPRAATGGIPRASTGGFPRPSDSTSVDEFSPIDGRQYAVTGSRAAAVSEDLGRPRHRAAAWQEPGRRSRGLLAGGVSGFLAAGTALGIANLTAAFVRPQASPVIAVGGWFIDHTPPALKNFAVEKFGENDKNMLLLGMYATIALLAIVIGIMAWRHFMVGVVGIGAFGAFGAFIAYTRPESRVTDVIPALVGGVLGIAVLYLMNIWTMHRGAPPVSPLSSPRGAYRSGWAA
jgi:hypothetical protein